MSLSSLGQHAVELRARAPDPGRGRRASPHHQGHAHFWQRALTRRQAVRTAAGASAIVLGGGLVSPRFAQAAQMAGAAPKPIPGGLDLGDGTIIHVFLPEPGMEPSTITDFRGLVGVNHVQGEGTVTTGGGGMSTPTAAGDRLVFDADMRFMKGLYVGEDGDMHEGAFAFI